jgi:hypothetical protein
MDLKQRLEFMDMTVALDVRYALVALASKRFMDQYFYGVEDEAEKRRLFKTNIANSYSYQLNSAMIERSVVNVAENIHEEAKRKPNLPVEIKHRWDLVNHRDYISHPGKVDFENSEMKKFIAEKKHYRDAKAVLLWRARQSILTHLEGLKYDGSRAVLLGIPLLGGVPELISTAINYSLNDGIEKPSYAVVLAILQSFFEQYEAAVRKASEAQDQGVSV